MTNRYRHEPIRALLPGCEIRSSDSSLSPTLVGRFAVFDQWTEIRSIFEGHFMERFVPGAFKKTMQENLRHMRVLFQHGRDPSIGDKPLGPIKVLREDRQGAYYEVPLLDTAYNRELLPALETGLYGASFRFTPIKIQVNDSPTRSPHNPDGLPEHTVQEARVSEFGPVTFPAYENATAGVRSLTDEFLFSDFASDPRLAQLVDWHQRTYEQPVHRIEPLPEPVRVAETATLWGVESEDDRKPDWMLRRDAECG